MKKFNLYAALLVILILCFQLIVPVVGYSS
ncbi:MAG: hypothetical protein FD167_4422, partial [bacterium]